MVAPIPSSARFHGLDGELPCRVGIGLQVRFVELHHVDARVHEVGQLLVDRLCVGQRERPLIRVVLVLGQLAEGERAGTATLVDRSVALRRNVAGPSSTGSRRRIGPSTSGTSERPPMRLTRHRGGPGHAVECVGEVVEVALASDLAIGDDVDAGCHLVADRQQRRRVQRLVELVRSDPPHVVGAVRGTPLATSRS